MYMNDFDDNGRVEQLMTYYVNGKEIPFVSKMILEKSIPAIRKKYLDAADFAKAELKELFAPQKFEKAFQLEANCFDHMLLINDGNGSFTASPLPNETQFSQIRAIQKIISPNGIQWMTFGNFYSNNVEIGRQDADFGNILQYQKGKGMLMSPKQSARVKGQVRNIRSITIAGKQAYILARNNDTMLVLGEN